MLTLRGKQGRIRCKKGQSIRTTRTVAFQVTDFMNGGVRLRFAAAQANVPYSRTPTGGRYALRKGQRFVVAPSMMLTVIRCQRSSVHLDIQAATDGKALYQRGLSGRGSFITSDTEKGQRS